MNQLTRRLIFLTPVIWQLLCSEHLLGENDTWSGLSSNRWSNSGNWTPQKPVNNDSAIFDASQQTSILADFSSVATGDPNVNNPQPQLNLQTITFPAGAPSYTIELYSDVAGGVVFNANLALSGTGVTMLSAQTQTFLLDAGTVGTNAPAAPASTMTFSNSAAAGSASYTLKGGETYPISPGIGLLRSDASTMTFNNTSSAASGTFLANGGGGNGGRWAHVDFHDTASASTATFTNGAGRPGANFQNQSPPQVDGFGGQTNFYNNSVAATAHFINLGEPATGGNGGGTQFFDNANADHGVFTNNNSPASSNGGTGGFTSFSGNASAGFGVFTSLPGLGTFSRGQTGFFGNSTAANGTFENTGGDNTYSSGGVTFFRDSSTAGNGTFRNYGTGQLSTVGGQTLFYDTSNAGSGTFTNVGDLYGPPGTIEFSGSSSAGNGTFYVTQTNRGGFLNFRSSASAGQGHFLTPGGSGNLNFYNHSTAANATFDLASNSISGPFLQFRDQSTAGNATFDIGPSSNLQFYETSTAAQSHIILRGYGTGPGGGASLYLLSTLGNALVDMEGATASSGSLNVGGSGLSASGSAATAGDAVINVKGGTAAGAAGASIQFGQLSTAGNATITIGGGTNGGSGAFVYFYGYYGLVSGGTSRIIANAGGTLQISGNIPGGTPPPGGTTFGSIEGGGTFILGNTLLVTGSRNTDSVVSGVITDGGSGFSTGGSLTKVGTGTLTLSGANSFTGLTNVNAGKLLVNGSIPGPLHVGNGATLGGNGTIGGAVTVDPGGIVSPGNSPGTISLGSLTLGSDTNLYIEIGGTTAGTTYDSINSTGNIVLGGTLNISLTNGFIPSAGNTFMILNAGGTVTGAFSNIASGARLYAADGSGSFIVSFTGNNIALSSYLGPAATLSAWQNSHFTPAQLGDPTISGPNADPDHDGMSNRLEYALNADPNNAASANLPTVTLDPTDLSLTYTKVLSATDLTYSIEQSTTVGQWGTVTPVNQILSDNGFLQVIKAHVPRTNAAGGKLFLRLSVTQQ
jgi:fibronectin-binding autotransporter adhesin